MNGWQFQGVPALVAHRGYAQRYPENTVLALAAAVSCGARFLEFDVQLTRDHVPVVCHDDTLLRCANDPRCVLDHDWAQLRDVRVGETARLGDTYEHTALSTLADVAAHLTRWPRTTSFVEIKQHSTDRFGVELCVARVLEALAGLPHPIVLLSFVDEVIPEARRQGAPMTGWVVRHWNEESRRRLAALSPDYVFCNEDKIGRDQTLWTGPWHWVLYEVTRPRDAERWQRAGAAMIETMTLSTFL